MNRQTLIRRDYNQIKVLGGDRFAWLLISVATLLISVMAVGLYYHELDHMAFDQSATTLSCIELEQLILGTHPTIDEHFVEESWERIGAIHNLRCK
jgi:hypothetical protein